MKILGLAARPLCPETGRVRYSKAIAKKVASRHTRIAATKIDWYKCPSCREYHIGRRGIAVSRVDKTILARRAKREGAL